MNCPNCTSHISRVVASRLIEGLVRRRRECVGCESRWSTVEVDRETWDELSQHEYIVATAKIRLQEAANHLNAACEEVEV